MKNILKIIGVLICFVVAIQFNYNEDLLANTTLTDIITNANASSEDSCMGATYTNKKPKTGNNCTCNGKFITEQSCESEGEGCTVIDCPD